MYITLLCGEFLPKAEESFKKELHNAVFSILHLLGDKASSVDYPKLDGDSLECGGSDVHFRVRCHAGHGDLLDLLGPTPVAAAKEHPMVIAYVGSCSDGGTGQWLLKDTAVDSNHLAKRVAALLQGGSAHVDAFGDTEKEATPEAKSDAATLILLATEKICSSWSAFPQQVQAATKPTTVHVELKPFCAAPDANDSVYTTSVNVSDAIMERVRPQPVLHRLPGSTMNGSVNFAQPTLYVFPEGDGNAAFFGVPGYNILMDAGFSTVPAFWNLVRCCYGLNSMLLTHWSGKNMFGVSSFLERIALNVEENNENGGSSGEDALSRMHQFGLLHPPGPGKHQPAGGDASLSLDVNVAHWANQLLHHYTGTNQPHVSTLEMVGAKSLIAAPRCFPLYQNWTLGTLELYVLNPLEDEAELKKFLAEWHKEKENFSTSVVSPSKQALSLLQCMSLCALLVWKPTDPQAHITRLLFPGACPQSRLLLALNAAQAHISSLKDPSGKVPTKSAAAPPSSARKTSPSSSKRGSVGSLGSGKPGNSAAAKKEPTAEKKPAAAAAKSAAPAAAGAKKAAPPSAGATKKEATKTAAPKKEAAQPAKSEPADSPAAPPTATPPAEVDEVGAHLSEVHLSVPEENVDHHHHEEHAPPEPVAEQLTQEQMREMGIFDDTEDVSSADSLGKTGAAPSNGHPESELDPVQAWGEPQNLPPAPPADEAPAPPAGKPAPPAGGKTGGATGTGSTKSGSSSGTAKSGSAAKPTGKAPASSAAAPGASAGTPRRTAATGAAATAASKPAAASASGGAAAATKRPTTSASATGAAGKDDKNAASPRPSTATGKTGAGAATKQPSAAGAAPAAPKSARGAPAPSSSAPGKQSSTAPAAKAPGAHGAPAAGAAAAHHPPGTSVASGHGQLSKMAPYDKLVVCYVDCAYIPAGGDPHLVDVEFFKRVRSRYYILSCLEPSVETLDALLIAKEAWGGADAASPVSLIPTYDSSALLRWVERNSERLAKAHVEVEPPANRCTVELKDMQTQLKDTSSTVTAYRLTF